VPRSIFLGRPWPQPGEPLWLDEDREWALALHYVEQDVCPDCRQPWQEATDPKNEGAWTAHLVRCHACHAAARTVGQFETNGGDMRGLHVNLSRG
jgi:hypothetical protein